MGIFGPGYDMFDSFIHPERGYEEAQKAANKGWDEAKGFQTPFMQHGLDQYGRLNDATGTLLDPQQLQNKWASGYEQSPYAKRMLEMNQSSGLDAASQMGLMGSSAAANNIQQGAGDIVSKDRQQYMNDLMQKYMTGIGLGQNLYGIGANAGQNLGNQAFQHGQNIAGLKYGETNAPGQLFGNLLKTGMQGAGNFMNPGMGMMGGF